jgi:alpha-2-macroglobulin
MKPSPTPGRRGAARLGAVGLLVLASCLHAPNTPPVAKLQPVGPDAPGGRTRGPFAVVHAAPRGHVASRAEPGVTVLFSRGVRSVDMADDARLPAVTITTKAGAPVAGAWRWTGTRGLLFSPEGGLPGGTDFVVTVPAGVTSLEGAKLDRPYTFEFDTAGPVVEELSVIGPSGVTERALSPDPELRIEFDQSVDPAAVAAAARLGVSSGDGDPGQLVAVVASRESAPRKPDVPPSNVVVLKPVKPLPLDHQITLEIAQTLRGTGGPRPMAEPYLHVLRTHGPLRVVDFYCPRISANGRCRAGGDVKVVLSTSVSPGELAAHVKAAKLPPRKSLKTEKRPLDPSTEHWLGVAPRLGEAYEVTLTAGMRDVFGQRLEKDATFDLAVEAPLVKPSGAPAEAQAGAPAAPASAKPAEHARPPAPLADARPRRERLPYHLDLGLVGQVLEANLPGGHKVPVGSVNIPTYAALAASLTDAQAVAWTLSKGEDFLTRNGLVPAWRSPSAAENERAVDFLDLDAALASRRGRGPALVVLAPPGLSADGRERTESFITVTDLGVSAKMSPYGGLVWVTQLSSGKPVQGASVAIRTAKQGDVFQGTTDGDGLAIVPIEKFDPLAASGEGAVRSDAAIIVRAGDDWTLTRVARSPVETRLTAGFESISKEGRWAGTIFADRGVFRPGETAKVSGIVRVVESDGLHVVKDRELRVRLQDRNGEEIFDGRAACDEFGTFATDVTIPKTALIGPATITATALAGGKSNTSASGTFSQAIRILEFKPNEFKVEATADKKLYVRGDSATFSVQGDYLYGAPMPGATVTTTVSRQATAFAPPGTDDFTTSDDVFTGDYPDATKEAESVDSQDGALDGKGSFTRTVSLAFADQRRPERVVFDADVQDMSRREVSARASVLVHPGEFYVAMRTPEDRFVAAGTALRPEVFAAEPDGKHRLGVKVKLELVERRWSSVTGEQPDGTPIRSSAARDTVATACELVTTSKGATCDLRVPRAGYFIVRATAADPRRNVVRASAALYGTEDAPTTVTAWAADDRHSLPLEPNKASYAVGDTAKIVLRSPFREGTALVTVERNGVLFRKVVPIKGPLPVVEVPIRPDVYPNAFVSVVAVRGRVQAPPASGADLGAPDYRYGFTEIKVDAEAHRLKVAVASPKTEYHPGDHVETDVTVTDASGKPSAGAVTFYVVDEGVLALTSYKTPDPLPAFVGPRKLSVFTFDTREHLARILHMTPNERYAPLGYEYALAKNGADYDKGDYGGDGGLKRADFKTTAYFEAGRKTDAQGRARFSFKLPDNLTTFRVMAVVAGADDRFGAGESKLTTYRKLMARPALPRLLRVGDALEASVIVSSKVDDAEREKPGARADGMMNVAVRLDAKGLAIVGPASRTATMPRGGQVEVRFPVKATAAGDAVLTFEAKSGADVDRVELTRKVELPVSVESSVVYGETRDAATIALGDLSAVRRDFGGLDVRMASSALVGVGAALDDLVDYPYGCTEQITSRALPLLGAMDLVQDGARKLPADVNHAIDAAIEAILKRQNDDGGFGYWTGSSSDPWLSAYAMLAVAGAADKKRFVPRDAIERGRDYLNMKLAVAARGLSKKDAPSESSETDDEREPANAGAEQDPAQREKDEAAKAVDYATATLIGDTLATLGWPTPGMLNVLYDARKGRPLFAQAALLHAMAKSEMSKPQLQAFAAEVEQRLRVGPSEVDTDEADTDRYAAVLDSHARTLAMVLRALLAADANHPLASRIARRLLALRRDGGWRTTHEDAWSLLALADYRRLQERTMPEIEARAFLGGTELAKEPFPRGAPREAKVLVATDALARRGGPLSFDVRGGGTLFYAASLKYATAALPARAADEGLFVQKFVRAVPATELGAALKSIPKTTASAVAAGELVLVDLLFESAEPRDHVVLDDPLPAGLEALDYDLDTTSRAKSDAEDQAEDREQVPSKRAWLGTTYRYATSRREVRDDRVVTYFEHLEPGMYRVHYLARATSVGAFVAPPTRVEAMYAPEVYGRTAASTLTVRAKP